MAITEPNTDESSADIRSTDRSLSIRFRFDRHFTVFACALFGGIFLLALLDLSTMHWWPESFPPMVRGFFDLSHGAGIGGFLAALLLLFAGVGFLALGSRPEGADFPLFRKRRWFWLGILFCFLSMDDATQLHDRVGFMFQNLARRGVGLGLPEWEFLNLFPSYGWLLLYAPVLGAMLALIVWILLRDLALKPPRRWLFLTLGCYLGAVGMSFTEGATTPARVDAARGPVMLTLPAGTGPATPVGAHPPGPHVLEESLELAGSAAALLCALTILSRRRWRFELAFESGADNSDGGDESESNG